MSDDFGRFNSLEVSPLSVGLRALRRLRQRARQSYDCHTAMKIDLIMSSKCSHQGPGFGAALIQQEEDFVCVN